MWLTAPIKWQRARKKNYSQRCVFNVHILLVVVVDHMRNSQTFAVDRGQPIKKASGIAEIKNITNTQTAYIAASTEEHG